MDSRDHCRSLPVGRTPALRPLRLLTLRVSSLCVPSQTTHPQPPMDTPVPMDISSPPPVHKRDAAAASAAPSAPALPQPVAPSAPATGPFHSP
jgi:hypothetical protein